MLRIKRGTSLYEVRDYGDRTEVNVWRVASFRHEHSPWEYIRTIVVPREEYRNA